MSRHRGIARAKANQKPMRVPLSKAAKNPRYMKLYVKEWLGLRRKEGAFCAVAGLIAFGIAILIRREMLVSDPDATWLMWSLIAVPVAFLSYAGLALIWPQVLFRLLHQREDVKHALESDIKSSQRARERN